MQVLFRPHEGRYVGGVALALSERFGLPLGLTRLALAAITVSSPYGALFYVLLWISLPGERRVLPMMEVSASFPATGDGYHEMSRTLLDRFREKESVKAVSAILAFFMLFYAVVLQLSHINETAFYSEYPILSLGITTIERVSGILAYFALGLIFLFTNAARRAEVSFWQAPRPRLELDATSSRVIFGLMSGLARVLNMDPMILRTLAVMISLLTFGIGAVAYVVAVILLDKRSREIEPIRSKGGTPESRLTGKMLRGISVIFFIFTLTKMANEFRLFFFNEPYVQGVLYITLGLLTFFWAFRRWNSHSAARLWMLLSPAIVFWGIYELSTALFHVQLPFVARFQIAYLIAGTVFIYYAIVTLRGRPALFGIAIGIFFYVLVSLIQFNVIPSRAMLLSVQFYEFFYPVIYAAAGLWVVMEK